METLIWCWVGIYRRAACAASRHGAFTALRGPAEAGAAEFPKASIPFRIRPVRLLPKTTRGENR
ncbi:hypothetical protein RBY4I_466 [Rhodobacterales bacterium Y4I]|nr:hypothetical protein RBY4I_466 [Rhodobacterales bacterium Y4I]